jgi:hypothetical protein
MVMWPMAAICPLDIANHSSIYRSINMSRTSRSARPDRRAGASVSILIEPLENRELLSFAAPVAQSPGTAASPGPVVINLNPTFHWSAVSGVSGYQVHIYDKTDAKYLSANVAGQTATSYKPSAGTLKPGDQFVWNVRDLIGTATGAVSNYLNFQLHSMPAPTIIGPGSSTSPGPMLTTLTPTLTWHAVTSITGFTGYQINLYDNTAKKLQSFVVSPTATSFKLPAGALTAGHSYVWNLRLRDGSLTGPESLPYLYFRAPSPTATLPKPQIVSPGSTLAPGPTLSTLTPTLKWNAVTGVNGLTGYQINLYDITTKQFITHTVGASVTQYTLPTPLTAGDQYVWNVRILVGATSGPPSTYLYFVA